MDCAIIIFFLNVLSSGCLYLSYWRRSLCNTTKNWKSNVSSAQVLQFTFEMKKNRRAFHQKFLAGGVSCSEDVDRIKFQGDAFNRCISVVQASSFALLSFYNLVLLLLKALSTYLALLLFLLLSQYLLHSAFMLLDKDSSDKNTLSFRKQRYKGRKIRIH